MDWYLKVLKQYADFNGRARRKEYWMFFLVNIGVSIVLGIVGAVIKFPFLGALYSLAILLPGIAVSIRRMHDIGKSGWLLLVGLIPFIGAIVLLVWAATEGTSGANEYGPDPKGATPSSMAAMG